MAFYSVPPPRGYYEYQPTASPASSRDYDFYVPSSYKTATLPSRRHTRTASYTQPRMATYSTPAGYTLPDYYMSSPPPSHAKYEYVSIDPHKRTATRRFSMSSGHQNQPEKRYASIRTSNQRIFIDTSERHNTDSSSSEDPIYVLAEPRLGRKASAAGTSAATKKKTSTTRAKADSTLFSKQAVEEVDTPIRSRARRSSTTTKQPPPPPPAKAKVIKPPRLATAEDALQHKIPAGFCLKNWDPTEKPIVLLGSVFDANSLGKWIYDWTVFSHQSQSPLAGVAGELWLLLIRFAAKMQRVEEGIYRVKYREDKAILTELLDVGDRVWRKLKSLIKMCEEAMWKGATKDGSRKVMGQKSGVAFVDTFFGRDGEMDKTERLMGAMRHFNLRFDTDCEDILRSLKK